MATTTITDLVRALNTTKTMVLAVDQEDASTGEIETVKIDLEQILNLFAVIGNEPPTGVAHAWTTDAIPTGYLELNGQTFDPNTYPQLGLIYPSGVLPDWRGRVAKHTPAGQNAGTTQEDEIKSHNHAISINNTDLGTKTSTSDSHSHTRGTMEISGTGNATWGGANVFSGAFYRGTQINTSFGRRADSCHRLEFRASRSWTGSTSTYSHSHTITLGSHNHTASCSNTGGSENLVKGVFVRYIVRAR